MNVAAEVDLRVLAVQEREHKSEEQSMFGITLDSWDSLLSSRLLNWHVWQGVRAAALAYQERYLNTGIYTEELDTVCHASTVILLCV